MNKIKIAPSLLAADFLNLEEELKRIESAQVDYLHLDVMDGHFVPNLTFGIDLISKIKERTNVLLDVHLMIENTYDWFFKYQELNPHFITIHLESVTKEELEDIINKNKKSDVKLGLSIKPNTKVEELDPYLQDIDLVLIMSVKPGFGGQSFMPNSLEKIEKLKKIKQEKDYNFEIEIDGGINEDTSKLATKSGCEILVSGSYLFSGDMKEKVQRLKND